jgi:acyl-CoA thioesterase-1
MNRRFLSLIPLLLLACSPERPSEQAVEADAPSDSAPRASGEARGPRVVFLGTSITAGLGLASTEHAYPHRLEELADSAGIAMEAVNAGVSGDTSAGGLRRLEWLLRAPLDVLVVELGANDGLRGQDPGATARNLAEIVTIVKGRYPSARVLLAAMEAPPNMGDSYTSRFRAIFPAVAGETGARLVPFLLDGVAGVRELTASLVVRASARPHRAVRGSP